MYEEFSLNEIINHYGFDPYEMIEKHINQDIIPAYDCLTTCHRSNHDEEGNPAIEFYIRYNVKLDFNIKLKLARLVSKNVHDFCKKSGFDDDVFSSMTLLVCISGDCNV
ncbi:MAG: hypothetical protein IJQ68_04825 [Methanobrevibacter sp.]|uniref:hypothetical protein n=1 Tax=Methanobrevibacter sp. TaxID=66852 RepID=UPI0025FBDD74|nr:hypothetical protein [Methanobrevibacter sp.]MBR0271302.1 hypothetical protein [Methanobrevibacter sp.]